MRGMYEPEVWDVWKNKTDKDIDKILRTDYSKSSYEVVYNGIAYEEALAPSSAYEIFNKRKKKMTIEY